MQTSVYTIAAVGGAFRKPATTPGSRLAASVLQIQLAILQGSCYGERGAFGTFRQPWRSPARSKLIKTLGDISLLHPPTAPSVNAILWTRLWPCRTTGVVECFLVLALAPLSSRYTKLLS